MTVLGNLDAFFSDLDLDAPEQLGADQLERAYLQSAALVSSFDPNTLQPMGDVLQLNRPAASYLEPKLESSARETSLAQSAQIEQKLSDPWTLSLVDAAEPVLDGPTVNLWTLSRASRRTILSQLGGREAILSAVQANPDRPQDPAQHFFEALLEGRQIDLQKLTREQLAGLSQAVEWLEGLIEDVPNQKDIQSQIERVEIIQVFRKLVGKQFDGRVEELRQLRDYIGFIPADSIGSSAKRFLSFVSYSLIDRPPLVIHGPGGIGKSTLVAKFILDHLESVEEERFPFAYLNFDRPRIEAGKPLTLIIDAAEQLGVQFSGVQTMFNDFARSAGEFLSRQDSSEASQAGVDSSLLSEFNEVLNEASADDTPFVMVLDTFEEVQYLGHQYVDVTWEFLERLQDAVSRLRIVIAGRAPIRHRLITEEMELTELEPPTAYRVLSQIFKDAEIEPVEDEILEVIVDAVGGNPLSLELAARVIKVNGLKEIRSLKTRHKALLDMKSEQVQGILYGRILTHLHDKDLSRLAYPGLLVRRITPEVISEVLAGPCDLKLKNPSDASDLFDKLSAEVALVEIAQDDPEPRVLRHRENVRRVMLNDLARVQQKVTNKIHHNAVRYYKAREGPIARAEEIYHRLWLGQTAATIDARWEDGLEKYLTSALEELRPKEQAFLASRLGITLGKDVLREAAQEDWERAAIRRVSTYLQSGDSERALDVLAERKERLPASELYRLEVSALRSVGNLRKARKVATEALKQPGIGNTPTVATGLLLLLALIDEEKGKISSALELVRQAKQFAESANDELNVFRAKVTTARLLRKLDKPKAVDERAALVDQIAAEARKRKRQLAKHPALHRAIIAEVGDIDFETLKSGINELGLEINKASEIRALAGSLAQWDKELKTEHKGSSRQGPLAKAARVASKEAPSKKEWTNWINRNMGSRLTKSIVRFLDAFPANTGIQESLTKQFRATVDNSIYRGQHRGRKRLAG